MQTNPFREHRAKEEALELEEKKKLDSVDKDELKGTHADRKDGDIDNDGDEDNADKFLHKKRKAISKSISAKKESAKKESVKKENTMTFREKLISVLERKEHYKGATEPETMDDKLKGKGAKDMAQPAKDAITAKPTIDEPEIIKKDFNKMTSNVKKSPMRKNDNAKGDSTIIAPGTPMNDPNKVQKEDFTAHPMNGKSMKDLLDAIKEVKADSRKTAK